MASRIHSRSAVDLSTLYSVLVQFPAVCFVGALITDVAYAKTYNFQWETFSIWLLTFGCVMAGFAGLVAMIDFFGNRQFRNQRWAWPHALLALLAAILSVLNAFVHSRDGYTAVVPDGLTLSAIVVCLMLVVRWLGWSMERRSSFAGAR